MNMSDDVTGVTLQIVQKGADVAAHAAKEFIDAGLCELQFFSGFF